MASEKFELQEHQRPLNGDRSPVSEDHLDTLHSAARNDEADMARLGRRQELNVRHALFKTVQLLRLTGRPRTAQLPKHLNIRPNLHNHGYMDGYDCVCVIQGPLNLTVTALTTMSDHRLSLSSTVVEA